MARGGKRAPAFGTYTQEQGEEESLSTLDSASPRRFQTLDSTHLLRIAVQTCDFEALE